MRHVLFIGLCLFLCGAGGQARESPLRVPSHTPEVHESTAMPAASAGPDERRLLFAQIVEDDAPKQFSESAILEGKPYKYFLKQVAATNQDNLRKLTDDQITFEQLMRSPGMFRGRVVTLPRGVVMEVSQAPLTPEYGLPDGYTVLSGVFVDSARDVYAFRMLCAPGSQLYEKIQRGIDTNAFPVARLCGYFMKLYARKTGDPRELPWRRPLLICPELEFSKIAPARKAMDEVMENHMEHLLGSSKIDAPAAEERLVLEMSPVQEDSAQWRIQADGQLRRGDLQAFISHAVENFRKRLPAAQEQQPPVVILKKTGTPRAALNFVQDALHAAGIQRLSTKAEQ